MEKLTVVFEPPPVCLKYFHEGIRRVVKSFKECDLDFLQVNNAYEKTLVRSRNKKLIVFTRKQFIHPIFQKTIIEGVGLKEKEIGVVSYASNSFRQSLFLFAHELGHIYGLKHCKNANCVMGYTVAGEYSWRRLSENKKLDRRIFCRTCRKSLRADNLLIRSPV